MVRRGTRMRSLLETVCLTLLLALALPHSVTARAEAKAIDVLPGAFGESIDMMDGATRERCIEYADRAREALLGDFERVMEEMRQEGYLQILQTTLLLPGSLPPDATDTDRAIWAELYEGVACVVSFVTIDNSMNLSGVPYAEVSGRFGDYAVLPDGSVKSVSLRGIRGRFFADPVVPGVRVINMGSHCNGIYTPAASADPNDAMPRDSDDVYNVKVGEDVFITVIENQTTPYRWAYNLSDDTMMECVYDEYIPDANPLRVQGVGGKHRFRFEATAPGTCWIDLYLVLMGDDIEEAVEKVTYAVIIEE